MQAPLPLEMPYYKSHKTVQGLKIRAITIVPGGIPDNISWYLHFEDYRFNPVAVPNEWRTKHNPQSGGYYVKYKNGYTSFHPGKTFEDTYALFDPSATMRLQDASVTELMEELAKRPEIVNSDAIAAITTTAREGFKKILQWIVDNKETIALAAVELNRRENER